MEPTPGAGEHVLLSDCFGAGSPVSSGGLPHGVPGQGWQWKVGVVSGVFYASYICLQEFL